MMPTLKRHGYRRQQKDSHRREDEVKRDLLDELPTGQVPDGIPEARVLRDEDPQDAQKGDCQRGGRRSGQLLEVVGSAAGFSCAGDGEEGEVEGNAGCDGEDVEGGY